MRMVGGFRRLAGRFTRNRSGNFGMMMAVTAPLLILGAGYGLNVAQISITKSNLLAALDAAVTSTARDLTTGVITKDEARGVVEAFLFANGERAYAENGRLTLDKIEIDPVAKTVEAQASVELDLAFALFGAANQQKVTAQSAAIYSDKKVEVAMMLDVTGSMSGQRLRDLKVAAKNAVKLLLGNNKAIHDRVRVALVPYADAVNAGPLSHTIYVESNRYSSSEPPAMPASQPVSSVNLCGTDRESSAYQFTDDGPDVAMVNRDYRLQYCQNAALIPLTTNQSALETRIDSFVASGNTAGQIGIQWTWYMLSPKWANVLPEASKPRAYDDEKAAKYAILMTDGEFNTAFADVPHGQNPRSQTWRSRTYAETLCTEMKKAGIEIFTIGFALNNSAKPVMQNCASPDTGGIKHFFDASTGSELDDAFRTIAANIERLALTR